MKKALLLFFTVTYLLIVIYLYYYHVLDSCEGNFIYSLDDSYIHLSLAKNFVENGNLGINPNEFVFATSSPLWTAILISIFSIIGYNELVPFYLNILIAFFIIYVFITINNKYIKNISSELLIYILIIASIPLIPMIYTGMEHLLHLLLSVIFIIITLRLKYQERERILNFIFLSIVTVLLTSVRYEAIFLIFASLIIMLGSRVKLSYIVIVIIFASLPHLILGLYSLANGGLFFPNSILLKGYDAESDLVSILHRYFYSGIINLTENTTLFVSFLLSLFLLFIFFIRKNRKIESDTNDNLGDIFKAIDTEYDKSIFYKDISIIFLITTVMQIQIAKTGWFYRYEAYLIGIFLIFLLPYLVSLLTEYYKEKGTSFSKNYKLYIIALSFVILLPFIHRGMESYNRLRLAPVNIYEQQYLISKFLDENYRNEPVGMNDIGVSGLITKVRVIDIYGLANNNIAKAKITGKYNPELFYEYLYGKNCKILVMFESWFIKEINYKKDLIRVATWKIDNNIVCGMDEVTFYAFDIQSAERLKLSLEKYKAKIPDTINLRILI